MLPVSHEFERLILRRTLGSPYGVRFFRDNLAGDHLVLIDDGAANIGEVRTSMHDLAMMSGDAAVHRIIQEIKDLVRLHEAQARLAPEQHKRMKAATLNRRKHLLPPMYARRATL